MEYNPAEVRLIEATQVGEPARFDGEIIRAEVIRRLMLGTVTSNDIPVAAPCGVRIVGADIHGEINLANGRGGGGAVMPGLELYQCRIADGIDISYAQMGSLSVEKSKLSRIIATRAWIDGEVVANDIGPATPEGVCFLHLYSLNVAGDIQLRRARLREGTERDVHSSKLYALDLEAATVKGNVIARYLDCDGTIHLNDSHIYGYFSARGGHIRALGAERPYAIFADSAQIDGGVFLYRYEKETIPFRAMGSLNFESARMGEFRLDFADIRSAFQDKTLTLRDARLDGKFKMDDCTCGGVIDLENLIVQQGFSAQRARLQDGLVARNVTVEGEFNLEGADAGGAEITLEGTTIRRALCVVGLVGCLNLRRVSAASFHDHFDVRRPERNYAITSLDGFLYGRLEQPSGTSERKKVREARLRWLASQRDYGFKPKPLREIHRFLFSRTVLVGDRTKYRPQPYLQLSDVLRRQGLVNDSKQILREMRALEARTFRPWTPVYWFEFFYGALSGFGFSPFRAVVVFALYAALGVWGVSQAARNDWLVYDPHPASAWLDMSTRSPHPAFLVSGPAAEGRPRLTEFAPCTELNPLVYTLDMMIPLVDLGVEHECHIRPDVQPMMLDLPSAADLGRAANALTQGRPVPAMPGKALRLFFSVSDMWQVLRGVYVLIGWIITSLGILTINGTLREKTEA